ncbi:HDOD domain-containing protein [Aromatoleum diolicum]|uniref:HDOD domain-containing protein n=1 Tax=Aromatoleum diolicum TaxID=75796 RepID=A0ABX1QGX7_9RHOO|nr:HDOD domain-containing protein [Aromatoleum diolicum]NMG76285.1 HDOD domain-containing protein [Aromatoleum diolicum]
MSAIDSPAHRFLLGIAEDLSTGDVSFPTYLDVAMRIRMALNRPDLTVDTLSRVVVAEPLVSAKVIRLANSAALNPSGKEITDIRSAVMRVGFSAIRTLAISVAIQQLMLEKEMAPYLDKARTLWEHSLDVAALSYVISRRMTRINPDEAMFAGLVHDIGHFYLLSQVARHPEVVRDADELGRILDEWHSSIGHAVLSALDAPESILQSVRDHEAPYAGDRPKSLAEVLFTANGIATHANPFSGPQGAPRPAVADHVISIIDESHQELNSIIAALGP